MSKIEQIISKIYRYFFSALVSLSEKRVSKKDFETNYSEMKNLYLDNKNKYDFSEFVVPQWNKNMLEIERFFLDGFSFSFLNHQVIKATMFMYTFPKWRDAQKVLISRYLAKDAAKEILREYNIGRPLLNDIEYITSGNNIHHLYHLVKFFKETGTRSLDISTVVEVGGGYGNMAKIYKKMNKESTYIIIDIPIFSYIQAVYLRTIYGMEAVHIVHDNDIHIKKSLINIIPLDKNVLSTVDKIIGNADLFISTWALSESNKAMQDYVKSVDYFKAKYLLLAYQKSVDKFAFAEDIKEVTNTYNKVFNEETEYVKDNYYLFCERKS